MGGGGVPKKRDFLCSCPLSIPNHTDDRRGQRTAKHTRLLVSSPSISFCKTLFSAHLCLPVLPLSCLSCLSVSVPHLETANKCSHTFHPFPSFHHRLIPHRITLAPSRTRTHTHSLSHYLALATLTISYLRGCHHGKRHHQKLRRCVSLGHIARPL